MNIKDQIKALVDADCVYIAGESETGCLIDDANDLLEWAPTNEVIEIGCMKDLPSVYAVKRDDEITFYPTRDSAEAALLAAASDDER